MLVARYGGSLGADRHYRVYTKFRQLESMPYLDGSDPDEDLRGIQGGVRLDLGAAARSSFMLRADVYDNRFGLVNSEDGEASGASVLARARRTMTSGAQLQAQLYYDTTFRRVPVQYAERRHTVDGELQYGRSLGPRHHLVSGVGLMVTHDTVTPTPIFSFDPSSRTSPLVNVFAQDDITLVTGRLSAIVGVKLEHNDFTGFEYQPTVRFRWTPSPRNLVWGAVSRAVRMPTRFDSDLRFTAGTPFLVIRGDAGFRSETVLARELGLRTRVIPATAMSVAVFVNTYDDLRSQEPTPPAGLPIVIANKHEGRVAGVEIAGQVEPAAWWHVNLSYARLAERFGFDADSRDPSRGALEHNDPAHQVRLRSYTDVAHLFTFDATFRWVGALPNPAVPAYGELTLRVSRHVGRGLDLEVVGDNLLHARHLEFVNLGRPHAVPRTVFARLTWRSQ
jgi:iron complex outermembrane recepter protein